MKKNILMLPTAYPNIYNDHSSIFVQDQAKALAKHGIGVHVLGAIPISLKDMFKKRLFKFGSFKYKNNGVNVHIVLFPSIPKLKFFNNFVRAQINKQLLKKRHKEDPINIIHVHNSTAGAAALWMKQKYNVPYIVTEHSSAYARGLLTNSQIKRYEEFYNNASQRIAVSKEFCKSLANIYSMSFKYIPNVVNTDYFIPIEKKTNELFQFINIANLNKNKNQILLIQAFAQAFQHNQNVGLSILGAGPEFNNLQNEINKFNMQKQIKLFGFARREHVLEELQKSDAFILSSKYETFGVVVLEAMCCGLPIISTKCGGPESIIENDELGILVENENLEEMSQAMKAMYANREKYKSSIIRNHIVENFSEKVIADKLISSYKKVIHAN